MAAFHRAQLKEARRRAGLTQAALAERIGVSCNFVKVVENGRGNPGFATMVKWLQALGADGSIDLFERLSPNEEWRPQKRKKRRKGATRVKTATAPSTKAAASEVA